MKKLSRLLFGLAAITLIVAACGNDDDASTAAPSEESEAAADPAPAEDTVEVEDPPDVVDALSAEPVTLIIPADIGILDYDAANAAFLEKFPNVTLEPGMGYWDAHDEPAFLAAAANESVNDVLTAGDEYPDTYGPRGIYLDMRPYLEADADLWFDDERFANWWIYDNPDGAIYSVPQGGNPMVVWYNPDLLAEAGLEPPPMRYDDPNYADWTWDRFTEYAQALSEVTTYGVGIENNILLLGPWVASNGGALINEDATEYLIDDPAVVETIEFMTSFTLDGLAPDPAGAQDLGGIDSLFQQGEIAMWVGGAWNTGQYPDLFEEMGFTPQIATLPNNGTTTGFVNCPAGRMGISAFADSPDAAYEYIKFMTFDFWDDPTLTADPTQYSPWTNVIPRVDVWNDIVAEGEVGTGAYGPDKQDLSFLGNDHCGKTMTLESPPWYGPFLEIRDLTLGELDLVFSGQQTVDEAVQAIKDQAQNAITRFNRGS